MFNRVQIRALRRQINESCPGVLDRFANGHDLISAEDLHIDDVAQWSCRHHVVTYPTDAQFAVDGSICDQRCRHARRAGCTEEERRLPVAVRQGGQKPLRLRAPATGPWHVRLRQRFVHEDESAGVQERLLELELPTPLRDIGTRPLRRVEDYSLNVRRRRCNAERSVTTEDRPCSTDRVLRSSSIAPLFGG